MRKVKVHLRTMIAQYMDRTGERLTYLKLSAATGVSTNTISHLVNNKQELLDRSVLERLCDFFGCELHDLVSLEHATDSGPDSLGR